MVFHRKDHGVRTWGDDSVFLRVLRGKTCDHLAMSTREEIDEELASDAPDERFNGAELGESVLGRDWNSPEEDAAWSNL